MVNYRDLTMLPIDDERYVIFACDSTAGIGLKEYDTLKIAPEIVAQMCIRVPLMELLCLNVAPVITFNLVGNEMNPTGQRILAGIHQELKAANFDHILQNGSTEENMMTVTTGMGIVLAGTANVRDLLWKKVRSHDQVYLLGIPYVGAELINNFDKIISYQDVHLLKQQDAIHEIVPIGSKGSLNEAEQTAKANQLKFVPMTEDHTSRALATKSAGPSTAVLVVGLEEILPFLHTHFNDVLNIGYMEE